MPPESPTSPETAKKPVRLGKYEILEHIATGGMGAIYRARDTEGGREVALKILPPEMAKNPAMVVRFRREYAAASKMRHENIVQLYELGELNLTLYFAMEYVDGIDLYAYARKQGTLDPEEARQIVLQGARALRHAHQHGVVHRDIKPSNFLLARKPGKPHVKLTDFGLAREVTDDYYRVTRAGTTVGTIDYMSPEQARDSGRADIRSDLYSLGSTWFHLLTGQSPFPDGGLGERLIAIMNESPPDARDLNPRVSDETHALLEKLLAKDPDDRHQTPEELIDDLLTLEGRAAARPKPRSEVKRKPKPKKRPAAEAEDEEEPPASGVPWHLILGAASALLVIAVLLAVALPRRRPPGPDADAAAPPVLPPVVVPFEALKDAAVRAETPKDGGKAVTPKAGLPVLYRFAGDRAALRAEVERPWPADAAPAGPALKVRRVATGAGTFRSLAEAAASAPAGGPLLIEVHDNGPLFELPLAVAGRAVTVRAGPGYRPLIVWDLPATLERRRLEKKLDQPLVFLSAAKGSVTLEGLEVGWRCPETLAEPVTLIAADGDVRLRGCTFSGAGVPREPSVLLRVRSEREGARVRLDRCHARGAALVALDLHAPAAEVLLDGCLLSSTQAALLKLRGRERPATNLRVVRSTLVGKRLIELAASEASDRRPGLNVLAWDAILARAGSGEVLAVEGGATADAVEWRPVNALYAGGGRLLSAAGKAIDDLDGWRKQWLKGDGDGHSGEAWPESADDPGVRPALTYRPAGPLLFASTADAARPLGCDLDALPRGRDGWVGVALDNAVAPPEAIADDSAPEIPAPGDERFHGARLDLNDGTDVGAYLAAAASSRKLGERVVLHLSGKGEKTTSPIRLRGATLVLHFEEPADKDTPRLALKGAVGTGGAVIDVEDGGLDVIGGVVRAPDTPKSAYAHVVRVRGGGLRLFRTRVEGPTLSVPDGYEGAVSFGGSGQTAAEKALACAVSESVILSSQKGLIVEGVGAKALVHQSLIAAGEGLALLPGPGCKGEACQQVTLTHSTLAVRRTAVVLGDVSGEVITAPVALRSRDCAWLCPFQAKPGKAGLIGYEGESLSRGLLVWQSERDALDGRLHFAAWPAGVAVPDAKEPRSAWARLVGSYGLREPRPELIGLRVIDGKGWALERLALPGREPPGANLARLGIGVKK